MKILFTAYTEKGGAGIAMRRLYEAFVRTRSDEVTIRVEHKTSRLGYIETLHSPVKRIFAWGRTVLEEKLLNLFYPGRPKDFFPFFAGNIPAISTNELLNGDFDIVNVHWNNVNALSLKKLARLSQRIPVVFTLHDMWTFTGGCPHPYNKCTAFQTQCGKCPLLGSKKNKDLAYRRFVFKNKIFRQFKNYHVITPSNWLKEEAEKSGIWEKPSITVIPNTLNTEIFSPLPSSEYKKFLRQKLGWDTEKKTVLLSVPYKQKGSLNLKSFYKLLKETSVAREIQWVLLGTLPDMKQWQKKYDIKSLPFLHDELSLAMVYSASDVYMHFSPHDNLPNTLVEASACGIPSVAFEVGGISDIVLHEKSGFLAEYGNVKQVETFLQALVSDEKLYTSFSRKAREHILENFSEEVIVRKHSELFSHLKENRNVWITKDK